MARAGIARSREATTYALLAAAVPCAILVAFLGTGPSVAMYYAVALLSVGVAASQARRGTRRRRRTALLMAAGLALLTLGDACYDLLERVLDQPPFPSIADLAYLCAYPLLAAAILRMGVRGARRLPAVLDGLLAGIGTGLLTWVFLVGPMVERHGQLSALGRLVTLGYPGCDVVLAVLAVSLVGIAGVPRRLVVLVVLATAAEIVADTAFMLGTIGGVAPTTITSVVFLLANLGWAASAVALPDRDLEDRAVPAGEPLAERGRAGLYALAWAFLAPPAVLAVQRLADRPVPVTALLVGSLLLWGVALVRASLLRRSLLEGRRRLAESEGHYLALAERASDLAARHAPDGTIEVVAQGAGRLLRMSDADLVGRRLHELAHEGDLPALAPVLEALRTGRDPAPVRYRLQRSDGEWVWVETTWFVVHGRDGAVLELRSATHDVARHKTFEEELAAVLAASSDVIMLVGPDNRIRFANDAVRVRLGRDPGALRGVRLYDLLRLTDDDARLAPLAALRSDRPVTVPAVLEHQRDDGAVVMLEMAAAWSGPLGAAVVSLRDVTHRVAAEEVARRSRAEYVSLVDNSPDAIERYGSDLVRVFANPAARMRFDRRDDDLGLDPAPWSAEVMQVALGSLEQQRSQVTDGHGATWEALFVPQVDESDGSVALLVIARDVTDRVRAEEAIAHAATHDELTGLPNRRLLLDRLDHALALAARNGSTVAVLFLDLDRFKTVNDALGHKAGDDLLVAAANRLSAVCRPGDTVARLGGDEFVVLAEQLPGGDAAGELAERLVRAFEVPFGDLERPVVLTASIGVACTSGGLHPAGDLLRDADAAMYEAKRTGRDGFAVFDDELRQHALRLLSVEAGLRGALERDELVLWYQPVVDLADGAVSRVEALLRWAHPERGLLVPADFLDVVAESGLSGALTQWVLDRALTDRAHHGLAVSVNLSAYDLNATLPVQVASVLARHHADPSTLWVEVPEHALDDLAVEVLRDVRALGVCISLDDLGAGYASLARLATAPVDEIKLDRALSWTVPEDPQGVAVVGSVVELARRLGVPVIGEGVESGSQLRGLAELGCHGVQGFLLAPPVPLDQLPAAIQGSRRRLAREQERRVPATPRQG